jgi:hypothetical protein
MRPALQRSLQPSKLAALPAPLHALAKSLSHGLNENEHFNFWADLHALSRGHDLEQAADSVLSLYLGDALFGLANATRIAGLQELAHGLSHLYAARAQGHALPKGLENLLPVLLMEAGHELRERKASLQERRVLEALRLAWSTPSLGQRGLRATATACRRALGAGRAMAAGQRALLLQVLAAAAL